MGEMLSLALPFRYSFTSATAWGGVSCNPSLQERKLRHRDLPPPSPSKAWQSPRLNQSCLALLPPAFFLDPEPVAFGRVFQSACLGPWVEGRGGLLTLCALSGTPSPSSHQPGPHNSA